MKFKYLFLLAAIAVIAFYWISGKQADNKIEDSGINGKGVIISNDNISFEYIETSSNIPSTPYRLQLYKDGKEICRLTTKNAVEKQIYLIEQDNSNKFYLFATELLCYNLMSSEFDEAVNLLAFNEKNTKYLPAAKALIKTKEWKWIYSLSEYLLIHDKITALTILKEFKTDNINNTSEIQTINGDVLTYNDVVERVDALLKKYNY
jgi:hypothetical protein